MSKNTGVVPDFHFCKFGSCKTFETHCNKRLDASDTFDMAEAVRRMSDEPARLLWLGLEYNTASPNLRGMRVLRDSLRRGVSERKQTT